MNAKYISSSAVKNQYYHECVARVYLLIFSPHVWYLLKKKSLNFMHFILRRNKESKLNFQVVSCPIWQFRIILGFHHSLHLENGLEEIITNETKEVSLLRKSFKCAGLRIGVMCKLTIAQPKGDVICFEIDAITPVVIFLKKNLFIKNRFEKVPVPELI